MKCSVKSGKNKEKKMKKMLIALTLVALAVSAQAGLLTDPNFTAGTTTNDWSDGSNRLYADDALAANGWTAMKIGNPSTYRWTYDADNDKAVYAQLGTGVHAFGQVIALGASESGVQQLEIDGSILTDADGDIDWEGITVLGFKNGTTLGHGYLTLNSTAAYVESGGDYTIDTLLASTDFDAVVGSTNLSFNIDLGTAGTYDYLMVKVGVRAGDLTDAFEVTRVDIVPEPATVGLLGLGALVSLLIRRIRA
jgi:hypothetical protein